MVSSPKPKGVPSSSSSSVGADLSSAAELSAPQPDASPESPQASTLNVPKVKTPKAVPDFSPISEVSAPSTFYVNTLKQLSKLKNEIDAELAAIEERLSTNPRAPLETPTKKQLHAKMELARMDYMEFVNKSRHGTISTDNSSLLTPPQGTCVSFHMFWLSSGAADIPSRRASRDECCR
jgi:hypothetical protein